MPACKGAHVDTELELERASLVTADDHIAAGERRVRRQRARLASLRAGGHQTIEAERLLAVLKATLAEWKAHRVAMRARIAYLETRE